MKKLDISEDDFSNLARLAYLGDKTEISFYLFRMTKKYKNRPTFALKLQKEIDASKEPHKSNPLRN
jgi:hypothetical protein